MKEKGREQRSSEEWEEACEEEGGCKSATAIHDLTCSERVRQRRRDAIPLTSIDLSTTEMFEERCKEVFDWVSKKIVKVGEAATFPLLQASDAQILLESRGSTGKLLLIV